MKISLILTFLFVSNLGFSTNKPEGLTRIRVFVKSFRVYNSVSETGVPGQKPNMLALRLDFRRPNQEITINQKKIVPQFFLDKLDEKGEWQTDRIPAAIYQDQDGEYIAAIRLDNLERFFEERSKGQWKLEDFKSEITRLVVKNYWRTYLICEYKITPKENIENDLGFTRTRITPDGFVENEANRGEVELKFHIGELGDVVNLFDIGDKLYLQNKNSPRLEVIKKVRVEKIGQNYKVAMGAPQLITFMKNITNRDVGWNKKRYEEFIWALQQDWKLYIISKYDKRYDNYNFKDYDLPKS